MNSPVKLWLMVLALSKFIHYVLLVDPEHSGNSGEWSVDRAMCCQCFAVIKRRSLKLHQRIKHEERPTEKSFLCTVCGKQSASKQIHEVSLTVKNSFTLATSVPV